MTTIMNDSRIVSITQLEEVIKVGGHIAFRGVSQKEKYEWIGKTLGKFRYFSLKKKEKSIIKRYLTQMTGYSDAQIARLIAQKKEMGMVIPSSTRRHSFPKKYTPEDIACLIETDKAHDRLSGNATKRIFQREYSIFGKEVFAAARSLSGRVEVVEGRDFKVIVDYAHEPASLSAIYETAKLFRPRRLIGVLGSQGGGRDVWKRAAMGKIAAGYCDELILTNEDPYDEEPLNIIADIEKGVREAGKAELKLHKIIDRREAIFKAVSFAGKGDVVVITGKGGEVWMCVAGGRKIPWSDREIVEEALRK